MNTVHLAVIDYSAYDTSATAAAAPLSEAAKAAIRAQSRRLVDFAGRIAG